MQLRGRLRGSGSLHAHIDRSSATAMACYTAEDVAQLFEEDGVALDSLCMEGSDDELKVEVVQNPFNHHVAEFEDFEEIEGIEIIFKHKYNTTILQ